MIAFTYIHNEKFQIGYAVSEAVAVELLDRWQEDFEDTYKIVSTHNLDLNQLDNDDIIYEDCFGGYTKLNYTKQTHTEIDIIL